MTGQQRDFEEALSRVLKTATDQIEPVGDGLTKIRGRLAEPWFQRQWWLLRSQLMMLRWLVVVRSESLVGTVRSWFAAADVTSAGVTTADAGTGAPAATGAAGRGRLGSLPVLGGIIAWASRLGSLPVLGGIVAWASAKGGAAGDPRRSPGAVLNWLRPALAVAGAVVLVVVGVFALGQIRQGIVSLNANGGFTSGAASQGGAGGGTNGQGSKTSAGGAGVASAGSSTAHKRGVSHHVGASSAASPCATQSSSPQTSSPAPSPTASATATPTPTATATPTPTATATPTPTVSSGALSEFQSPAPLIGRQAGRRVHTSTTALVCTQLAGPTPTSVGSPT